MKKMETPIYGLLLGLLSGCFLLISVQARVPQQAQIVFQSDRNGNWEIYVMDADGENARRLTNNPEYDGHPAWSPDGRKIAFYSQRDDPGGMNSEIYVMDADGENIHRITNDPALDEYPAWSPNGQKIAFISGRDAANQNPGDRASDIYVMDADGRNVGRLTNLPCGVSYPAWSPDGLKIAFSAFCAGKDGWNSDIHVMDADGKNIRKLAEHPGRDEHPTWSPDGRLIAFHSDRDKGALNWDIYVMDADGNSVRNLTDSPTREFFPAWSPGGRQIAFSSDRGERMSFDIYVMDADGSNVRSLLNQPGNCPAWFDPALAHPVSPAGKLTTRWGSLK